ARAPKTAPVPPATRLEGWCGRVPVGLALMQSGLVTGEGAVSSLARVLTGVKGLTFTATIDDKTKAEVRIEFSVPTADFAGQLKSLWPKTLDRIGFDVEEFRAADLKADGRAMVATAELSDTSLRRSRSPVAP